MKSKSIKYWAFTASILIHLLFLIAFAFAKFSDVSPVKAKNYKPVATVESVKKLAEQSRIIPKPKIKTCKGGIAKKDSPKSYQLPQNPLLISEFKPDFSSSNDFSADTSLSSEINSQPQKFSEGIEIFTTRCNSRRICFVVDSSGSMRGIFKSVQRNLKHSIMSLQADEYFSIIFFGSGRTRQLSDGKMKRATEPVKISACKFIDSVTPQGQTNAIDAIEKAFCSRDENSYAPEVIYFLTDGFEVSDEQASDFLRQLLELRKRYLPNSKINTIGFWPQGGDKKMLKHIAEFTQGQFVCIDDLNNR